MSSRPHQKWNRWYGLAVWQKRRKHQFVIEPFCCVCTAQGRLSVVATEVDHVEPHRGNWMSFRLGAVQSLCASCHGHKKFEEEHGYSRAIGEDGWPIDPRHPVYGGKREHKDDDDTPPVLIG